MNEMINTAFRTLCQMIMTVNAADFSCCIMDYNEEIRTITKGENGSLHSYDEFCNQLMANLHPADREDFKGLMGPESFERQLANKVHVTLSARIRQTDGHYHWSQITMCNAAKEDSFEGDEYLFIIRDIHDTKLAELKREFELRTAIENLKADYDKLFEENMTDQQTGCYNRKGLLYYSDLTLKEARESGLYLFVCVADLNGLKHLNDTFGHMAGDEAIAAVSKELINAAPKGSRIVRTGGDEFLMFAAINADSKEPVEMERLIDEGLKTYNEAHSNPFEIGASYGWVLLPLSEGMQDLDEYIAMADAKMYEMKCQRDLFRRD